MDRLPAFEAYCENPLNGVLLTNMGSGTEMVKMLTYLTLHI